MNLPHLKGGVSGRCRPRNHATAGAVLCPFSCSCFTDLANAESPQLGARYEHKQRRSARELGTTQGDPPDHVTPIEAIQRRLRTPVPKSNASDGLAAAASELVQHPPPETHGFWPGRGFARWGFVHHDSQYLSASSRPEASERVWSSRGDGHYLRQTCLHSFPESGQNASAWVTGGATSSWAVGCPVDPLRLNVNVTGHVVAD